MGIYSDLTNFLHFDLSEMIAFASYLPVTPALPVTSESGPLPLDYSMNPGRILLLYSIPLTPPPPFKLEWKVSE